MNDREVVERIEARTVPARLLLGHRIDPEHVDYFPRALVIADRFGVRHDPAYVIAWPGGRTVFKHVGRIDKSTLLAALESAGGSSP